MRIKNIPLQNLLFFAVLTLTLCGIIGCENGGDCNINNVSYNRIYLYKADPETQTEEKSVYTGTLTVSLVVNGKDSIVVNHVSQFSELAVPMCYTQECDTLVFLYENDERDTLFVEHTNTPFFIALDCGMGMFHNLKGLRYTNSFIDSAKIEYPLVDFDAHENIKLYLAQ